MQFLCADYKTVKHYFAYVCMVVPLFWLCCFCLQLVVKGCYLLVDLLTGKPGKPEGPLKVSGVTADSCKLTWEPPKDCGGSPVTHYVVEKMDVADGVWKKVTKFCRGTSYQPTDLVNGK